MKTPAYIFDETEFTRRLALFSDLRQETRFKLLYSLKALPLRAVLEKMLPYVDGFSVSSLFEARLARSVLTEADYAGQIHITTPGFRAMEMAELSQLCNYISLNSLTQWQQLSAQLSGSVSAGLRINPQLSFLDDSRYDPCRAHSKLGVGLDQVKAIKRLQGLKGIHFHSMFAGEHIEPLRKTLSKLESQLGDFLHQLEWINLGGGYMFDDPLMLQEFKAVVCALSENYNLSVFFEPGKGIIGDAGELISEVIDVFESEGRMIAVLDTSVCHHPEIFEYQRSPEIRTADTKGQHQYFIVGCSCMSGDWFGEYGFPNPLEPGDRLTLMNVGAYSLAKANQFNGINLPSVYLRTGVDAALVLEKEFSYEYFSGFWASNKH